MLRQSYNTWRLAATLATACLATGVQHAAYASNLGVSPVLLDVAAGDAISGVRVRNGDMTQAVRVQARVFRWQQDETGDVYTPTTDVVTSPPVTQVQPDSDNLVRVVRVAKHAVQQEESYRLLIDELPAVAAQPGSGGGVQMLIRHAVPVFFAPAKPVPAQVQWRITRAEQGGWQIHVHNAGGQRVRLADLRLHDANGTLVAQRTGLVGYVLGQSSVKLSVPALNSTSKAAQTLRVSVRTETDTLETELLPVGP